MTIREIIQQKVSKQSGQIEPIDFAWFQINMAGIIVSICYDLAQSDVGKIYLGKQNVGRDKADIPAIADIIPIINGDDMLRNMILTRQVIGFFNWFLDQDEPGEGEEDQDGAPLDWCDMSFILRKWNEYANTENGKQQQGA